MPSKLRTPTEILWPTLEPLPGCNMAGCPRKAHYDSVTQMDGIRAFLCEVHFQRVGTGLGVGRGQRIIKAGEGS